jgi:hypothetical protein
MRFTFRLNLALLAVIAAGCVDPESPRVRFVYDGTRTGKVWVTQRAPTTGATGLIRQLVLCPGGTIEGMRRVWNGDAEPAVIGAEPRLWGRSQMENGGVVTGWIDVDGDDAERCRWAAPSERASPLNPLLPSCAPEPGDPMGSIPAPPFEAVIPLVLHDPESPSYDEMR